VLSKFYGHFPKKQFTYEYLRPDIETYKSDRLKEGASPTTVNMELSIIRGFFRFLLRLDADGVFLNPAEGVRAKPAKRKTGLAGSRTRFSLEDSLSFA
jgi:site-specific recombinase XerC